MNFKYFQHGLEKLGIWRCKFVEYHFCFDKLGIIEMYVPKTTDRSKITDFIYNYVPVACAVQVKEMKSPLKYKKYTYLYEIKEKIDEQI